MLKNDYMKEIENTLKLIREEIDKNIINGDLEKAKDKVNKELKAIIGLDIGTADIFSFQSIEGFISKERHHNAEKFIIYACLMYMQGIICDKENNENAKVKYYERSIEGFFKAYTEDEEINYKYLNDAVYVASELGNFELSLDIDKKIFKLYELANKLDKAEDTLFYMLRKTNNDKNMLLEGMNFYNRLEEREHEELIDGNLPIEEVEDGISEIERRIEL